MEWIVLVVLGVGLGLPLLGGWLYLMRRHDPTSGERAQESMDHPTLVEGTEDHWDVQRGHVELDPGVRIDPDVNDREFTDTDGSSRW